MEKQNVDSKNEVQTVSKSNKFNNSKFGKAIGLKPDTSVKTEIIAGITTFFAMCYIIIVNPNQIVGFNFGGVFDGIWNAVYVGTIIAAVIGTLLYAFLAKNPFAQASGMGLNSFFFVSFVAPAALNPAMRAASNISPETLVSFPIATFFLLPHITIANT